MFLTSDDIRDLLDNSSLVTPFKNECVKSGAYELTLDSEFFTTNTRIHTKRVAGKNNQIAIEPGQFALLITREYVRIPADKLGFISIKARVKFEGLINVSGFHVDPGFEGKLKFSVYNAGSKPIILDVGKPLFPLWISEFRNALSKDDLYKGDHNRQKAITGADISAIAGVVMSPAVLAKKIDSVDSTLDKRVTALSTEVSHIKGSVKGDVKAYGAGLVAIFLAILGFVYKIAFDGPDEQLKEKYETKQAVIDVRLSKQDSIINSMKKTVAMQDSLIKGVLPNLNGNANKPK